MSPRQTSEEQAFRALVGERVRRVRETRGFSQTEVSRRMGMSDYANAWISQIELGRRGMSLWTAHRLARALRVDLSLFLS